MTATYERRPVLHAGPGMVATINLLPLLKGNFLEQVVIVGSHPEWVETIELRINNLCVLRSEAWTAEDGTRYTGGQNLMHMNRLSAVDFDMGIPGLFSIFLADPLWQPYAREGFCSETREGFSGPGLFRTLGEDLGFNFEVGYFYLTFNNKQPNQPVDAFFVWGEF